MKTASLVPLLVELVRDQEELCSTEASKDIAKIKQRSKDEGLSFLTITLPSFLDDFHQSLEKGKISSSQFIGWKKRLCLPAFLSGFTRLIFDAKTGRILHEPSIKAVRAVRQICAFFKKVKFECTITRLNKAYNEYKRTDDAIQDRLCNISDNWFAMYKDTCRMVVSTTFRDFEYDKLIPHHGPGSTAEGIKGNKKYSFRCSWPKRLEEFFGVEHMFNSEESYYLSGIEVDRIDESDELPVRVVSVPKTQKTPRIIAMEPVAMQMAQQALKDYMVESLEKGKITGGHVNFRDQTINQNLALDSSYSQYFATIDLSAASDRVHNELVKVLFEVFPKLSSAVQCTRSTHAKLPDGSLMKLNKFASMGSALCFPVESLYFFILCIMGRLVHNNLPLTYKNVITLSREVYVYGDDIIVPANEVEAIYFILEEFGNKVGHTKSFHVGKFRESCGMDAYDGVCVTPVYMRNTIPDHRTEASALISSVATANQLRERGCIRASAFIKKKVEEVLGPLPRIAPTSPCLGWLGDPRHQEEGVRCRYSKRYQRKEVLAYITTPSYQRDVVDGYSALAKCLLQQELRLVHKGPPDPYTPVVNDVKHLTRSPRHGAVTLKRRWATLF